MENLRKIRGIIAKERLEEKVLSPQLVDRYKLYESSYENSSPLLATHLMGGLVAGALARLAINFDGTSLDVSESPIDVPTLLFVGLGGLIMTGIYCLRSIYRTYEEEKILTKRKKRLIERGQRYNLS